jgi:glycosyltransferase involved in cell wall biosynthesis
MNSDQVFIIIPAYNEEERIGQVITGLFECGYKQVVVVDDGSSDQTITKAHEAGALVLQHTLNRGQGATLETGDVYARSQSTDIVVHFDGDGQFNPEDIKIAIEKLEREHVEVVLGSRFLDHRTEMPWFKKQIIFPIGKLINYVMTGVRLTDVHNGFRVFSRTALEKIHITQDRMAHNSEIVALIKKHNLSYMEIPVEVRYHEYGQGMRGGFKILKEWIIHLITR